MTLKQNKTLKYGSVLPCPTEKTAALSALSAPGAPPPNGGAASARGESTRAEAPDLPIL